MTKKKTKKETKIAKAASPIEETIKSCDAGILVVVKNGNVEVVGIKNTNFAYEAIGLMTSALNTYNIRPILNNTANNSKVLIDLIKKAK